jgi:hypothetical protein
MVSAAGEVVGCHSVPGSRICLLEEEESLLPRHQRLVAGSYPADWWEMLACAPIGTAPEGWEPEYPRLTLVWEGQRVVAPPETKRRVPRDGIRGLNYQRIEDHWPRQVQRLLLLSGHEYDQIFL